MNHAAVNPFLILGFILVAGYFAGKAANYFRLPQISGYIIVGLVCSPSISGILTPADLDGIFSFTSHMALAVIAYSIGGSLQISQIRKVRKEILWITFMEGAGAFLCTFLACYAAVRFLPAPVDQATLLPMVLSEELRIAMALVLGGIAVATAPAATLAVIHEVRAKGPLTTTLLGVVALDDALSIMIFSVVITVVVPLSGNAAAGNFGLLHSAMEIGGSLVVGIIGGLIFSFFLAPQKRPESNLMLSLGAIFFVSGVADFFSFSPLLANMAMGCVVVNKVRYAEDLFHQLDIIEETLFCLFFSLAAAHFDVNVLATSASLGVIILLSRFGGKLGGSYLGGKIAHAPVQVSRYLGITLFPQAGIALGLIFLAEPVLPPEIFELLLSGMLAAIILNEIFSPPLVKWVLGRVGESNPDG